MPRLAFLFLICLLVACQSPIQEVPQLDLSYTYQKETAQTHPTIRGAWQSIGNGYLLEVRADSILLYSHTASFCYKEKNDYLEGLYHTRSQFTLHEDTLSIYLTDYGTGTQELQTKKDFFRIDKLPEDCLTFKEMLALPNPKQFELYQETLKENYAFTTERQMDWNQAFSTYQDSITNDDQSLFEAMGAIATLTKDH
ncbi:MAG: hypothetical protein AAF705_21295, partial [Bacteroidota bacterium]